MKHACIDGYFNDVFKKKAKVFIPGKSRHHGSVLADKSKTIIVDVKNYMLYYFTIPKILNRVLESKYLRITQMVYFYGHL